MDKKVFVSGVYGRTLDSRSEVADVFVTDVGLGVEALAFQSRRPLVARGAHSQRGIKVVLV